MTSIVGANRFFCIGLQRGRGETPPVFYTLPVIDGVLSKATPATLAAYSLAAGGFPETHSIQAQLGQASLMGAVMLGNPAFLELLYATFGGAQYATDGWEFKGALPQVYLTIREVVQENGKTIGIAEHRDSVVASLVLDMKAGQFMRFQARLLSTDVTEDRGPVSWHWVEEADANTVPLAEITSPFVVNKLSTMDVLTMNMSEQNLIGTVVGAGGEPLAAFVRARSLAGNLTAFGSDELSNTRTVSVTANAPSGDAMTLSFPNMAITTRHTAGAKIITGTLSLQALGNECPITVKTGDTGVDWFVAPEQDIDDGSEAALVSIAEFQQPVEPPAPPSPTPPPPPPSDTEYHVDIVDNPDTTVIRDRRGTMPKVTDLGMVYARDECFSYHSNPAYPIPIGGFMQLFWDEIQTGESTWNFSQLEGYLDWLDEQTVTVFGKEIPRPFGLTVIIYSQGSDGGPEDHSPSFLSWNRCDITHWSDGSGSCPAGSGPFYMPKYSNSTYQQHLKATIDKLADWLRDNKDSSGAPWINRLTHFTLPLGYDRECVMTKVGQCFSECAYKCMSDSSYMAFMNAIADEAAKAMPEVPAYFQFAASKWQMRPKIAASAAQRSQGLGHAGHSYDTPIAYGYLGSIEGCGVIQLMRQFPMCPRLFEPKVFPSSARDVYWMTIGAAAYQGRIFDLSGGFDYYSDVPWTGFDDFVYDMMTNNQSTTGMVVYRKTDYPKDDTGGWSGGDPDLWQVNMESSDVGTLQMLSNSDMPSEAQDQVFAYYAVKGGELKFKIDTARMYSPPRYILIWFIDEGDDCMNVTFYDPVDGQNRTECIQKGDTKKFRAAYIWGSRVDLSKPIDDSGNALIVDATSTAVHMVAVF